MDFHETFSPVVKPATVRLVLGIAMSCRWALRQLDVSNAFLHGFLKEEVFMHQPPGYVTSVHPYYVCKLHKSLYGLKQAPRAWFERLLLIYLLMYVDDIIVTSNDASQVHNLIATLGQVFELKDLGHLNYFLGIQITQSSCGLTLTQTSDVLHNMENSKPTKTLSCSSTRLVPHDVVPLFDPTQYRSMVGALQYLTLTRPYIAFSVQQLCQFMSHPTTTHLEATKRVLCYISGTLHLGISFTPGPLTLTMFSDTNWVVDPTDRHSTTSLLVFLGNNPISRSAKKQSTVSRSSIEAEYRALASTAAELSWLRTLFKELCVFLHHILVILCDNVSTIALSANPVFHSHTKHLEVDYHFTREKVLRKQLQIGFVSGQDNFADIFTKPLHAPLFWFHRAKLLVDSFPISLRGDVEHSSSSRPVKKTKKIVCEENAPFHFT